MCNKVDLQTHGPFKSAKSTFLSSLLRWKNFSSVFTILETDLQCVNLLRSLLRNPPNDNQIAINICLSKARYRCYKSFKLVGKEIRTRRRGKWKEREESVYLTNDLYRNLSDENAKRYIARLHFWLQSSSLSDLFYQCLWWPGSYVSEIAEV